MSSFFNISFFIFYRLLMLWKHVSLSVLKAWTLVHQRLLFVDDNQTLNLILFIMLLKFLQRDTTRLIIFTCVCNCIAQLLKSTWNIVVMNIFECIKLETKYWNINSDTFSIIASIGVIWLYDVKRLFDNLSGSCYNFDDW